MVDSSIIVAGVVGVSLLVVLPLSFRVASAMHYSYSNARARVMKSRLLAQSKVVGYCDLGFAEIVSDLESGNYRDLITKIGDGANVDGIQFALNCKLQDLNSKLLSVVPKPELPFFKLLLEGVDFQNMVVLVRLKLAGKFGLEFKSLLTPSVVFPERSFEDFLSCSLDDLKVKLRFTRLKDVVDSCLVDNMSAFSFESSVNRIFFSRLLSSAKKIASEPVLRYARMLVDLQNVRSLSSWKDDSDAIDGGLISKKVLSGLRVKDFSVLSDSYLSGVDVSDLSGLRVALERYIHDVGRSLLFKDPLSINSVLGYHILKDAQISNLKRILKLKVKNVNPEVIRGVVI